MTRPPYRLHHSDNLTVLRRLPDGVVDALVTDPPAGIGFMGKSWDEPKSYEMEKWEGTLAPPATTSSRNPSCRRCGGRKRAGAATKACVCPEGPDWNEQHYRVKDREAFIGLMRATLSECFRVLKPGAHALVWAIPRTSHWTATAVEDAGFEIRDVLAHIFGSGFPKSADVSKLIDKAAGAEREAVGTKRVTRVLNPSDVKEHNYGVGLIGRSDEIPVTAPATEDAKRWAGFGTALKPAVEHWILARKPLIGTVAQNVLTHGTGALNVDGCRVDGGLRPAKIQRPAQINGSVYVGRTRDDSLNTSGITVGDTTEGRWPPNLLLTHAADCDESGCVSECPIRLLDEQSGASVSRVGKPRRSQKPGDGYGMTHTGAEYGDAGGASRFFPQFRWSAADDAPFLYAAKASRRERNEGLPDGQQSKHPTVKNIAPMRWLCRLVTPPGGLILDPFMGSGSTGVAALREGFRFAGIEQDADYFAVASARIAHAHEKGKPTVEEPEAQTA